MTRARPEPDLSEAAPPLWEQVAALIVIVILTQALIGPIFAPTQEETPILRLVWLPIYAMIAGLCVWRWERLVRVWPAILMLFLMVLHAFASKYWSIDPGVTQRRVIALAITGAFSIYLGAAFRGPHLPRLLMIGGLVMGVGSLMMVFAFPAIGVHQAENFGLWRGLWYEKNQMGIVMVATGTAAAAVLAAEDRLDPLAVVTIALSTGLMLMTQSKTSLLCMLIGLGGIGALWAMRKGGAAFAIVCIWLGVILVSAGAYLFTTNRELVLQALGKDPSLTGRTDIWAALMRMVEQQPWTGFGYSAFWGRDSIPALMIRQETQWPVPSAHNGWIDLLVQLGWPGAVLVAVLLATTTLISVLRSMGSGLREGWWALGFLGAFFVLSLSESILVQHQSLPWVLFLAVLTRAILPSPVLAAVPLVEKRGGAYQTGSRIAAQYPHGPVRRPPFAVR